MDPFWSFARRMLRYRSVVVAAVIMAFLSAGGLGVGLLAIKPVLETILGTERRGLPEMAVELNDSGRLPWPIPQHVIDSLPPGPFTALVIIMVALAVLTVAGGVANFLHQYLAITVVNRTVTAVRREAFHRVVRLPLGLVFSPREGGAAGGASDAISRIVNDTAGLGQGLTALLSKATAQLLKGVAALLAALVIDWKLTAIALLVAPGLFFVIRRLGKKIRRASKRALVSQADLYLAANEALQGLRVVKVHNAERVEAGRFHRINKQVMRELNRVRTARALASPLVEGLSIFVLGGLMLGAGKAIIDGHLAAETLLTVLAALFAAGASLKPLTGLVNDIQQSGAAAERLKELLSAPPEPGHDATLAKLPRHRESIEFRRVYLTYPRAERPVLYDINLRVEHGETIAVVGPNGSGKTTLLALIPRLFDPDSGPGRVGGQVLIDGRDIRLVNLRSLRRQIGVVTQETVLFKGTIRSNIAYAAEGATEERIRDAARRARADSFVEALPKGYESEVVEQGLNFSGGQRQRIAIARAILREPAILILDEATSMVDAESEAQINAALGEFSRGRTCLIVAHRLSTVLSADRIVVMDQGRIVDVGRHAELLERCAAYRQIAQRQLFPMPTPESPPA